MKRIAGLAPALVQFRRAIEKPRKIRLPHKSADTRRPISITAVMRVLGYDSESVAACILAEAVIPDLVNNVHSLLGTSASIESAGARETSDEHSHMYFSHFSPSNVARVFFEPCVAVNIFRLQRDFSATSSCGMCETEFLQISIHKAPVDASDADNRNILASPLEGRFC
jgi:hypothetical protein